MPTHIAPAVLVRRKPNGEVQEVPKKEDKKEPTLGEALKK